MDISVLIATYRRPHLLEQTLKGFLALETDDLEWEVVIADNQGDEKTKEIVWKFFPEIPVKYFIETRRGKNNALNRIIPEAEGELVIFTDDDVIPDPNWLVEMWEGAKRWPRISVFGGKCLPKFPDGQRMPFDHPFFEGAFTIADWDQHEGFYNADRVWGPNMAIRSSIFGNGWRFNCRLGPDGTDFCILGDETDLTIRLEKAGYRAVYLPRSIVYHQIQKERMTFKWLFKRAFSFGREDAYIEMGSDLSVPKIGGIPRYLYPKMIKVALMFALSWLSGDKRHKFDRGVNYWHTRGMIYQYRKRFS
jgi:GT2 family glycosyltransferase